MRFRHLPMFAVVPLAVSVLLPIPAIAASEAFVSATKCRKALTTQGRKYADQRRKLLAGCSDRLVACEIGLEIGGVPAKPCRDRAADFCKRKLGPANDSTLNKARARFDAKVVAGCTALGVDDAMSAAPGGLGFGNSIECGASATLVDLATCIRESLEADVDDAASRVYPRAGMLLDNVGLGSGFPSLTRPPTADVLISATAPASCVLVDPGTLVLGTGEALRFTGDSATLPVGGGKNGRLTVRASADPNDPCGDPTASEGQLKEPYDSGESITVGPFPTDRTYCIELKDSSCTTQITGAIDVP